MVELLWGAFVRVGQVGHAERNHDAHITQFSHLKCLSLVVTEQIMVSLLIESRACFQGRTRSHDGVPPEFVTSGPSALG